ncbi:hypothetical protein C8R45DRAFT_1155614 [Mycena sanguinolenta]|nr:hypothetical protein C8R45DRAFT_1155614 [Mycena sanguinolenta]
MAVSRVPNELWCEVLESVGEYDRSTGESFSLTCRAFCGITRARLFSKIRFTPYFIDSKGRALLPSPSEVDRRIERLDFLSSPGVASFRKDWTFSTDTPYVLLDALFKRLVLFTSLQGRDLSHIILTQARVNILFRLPHLSQLHVFRCAIDELVELSPQGLHLSGFRPVHDAKLDHGEDYWIPALHPDHLCVLAMRFVARAVHSIPSFPNVHKLTALIHDSDTTPSQNLTIMSKFPSVRILTLSGKEFAAESVPVQPRAVFLRLEEYYGHCHALSLFVVATPLRRVRIECAGPKAFLTRIQAVSGLEITSLNAKFNELDNAAFNKIVKFLPQLTELLLTIAVSDTSRLFKREIYDGRKLPKDEVVDGRLGDWIRSEFLVSTFFLKLSTAPSLPSKLERLAINWGCYEAFFDELSAYKLPVFPRMRDAFVVRCPRLTWLWFNGIYFMYEWRDPMPDGKVKEYIGKNYMDAYRKREGAAIFDGWEFSALPIRNSLMFVNVADGDVATLPVAPADVNEQIQRSGINGPLSESSPAVRFVPDDSRGSTRSGFPADVIDMMELDGDEYIM